jgi:hypothetical protein
MVGEKDGRSMLRSSSLCQAHAAQLRLAIGLKTHHYPFLLGDPPKSLRQIGFNAGEVVESPVPQGK